MFVLIVDISTSLINVDTFEYSYTLSNLLLNGKFEAVILSSKITKSETFDIEGEITPRCDLTVVMTRANGEVVKFDVLCRLDTSAEVDVYKNGGILQKFAKDVIASSK